MHKLYRHVCSFSFDFRRTIFEVATGIVRTSVNPAQTQPAVVWSVDSGGPQASCLISPRKEGLLGETYIVLGHARPGGAADILNILNVIYKGQQDWH